MSLALEKVLFPSDVHPGASEEQEHTPKLDISVVFTSVPGTLRALREAAALAAPMLARLTLVVPQLVPYPRPLESPPVLLEFNERRFLTLAAESRVETTVRIYLCRDRWDMLGTMLRPNSLVVLGVRKRWWPTADARLARRLRKLGHEVVVVDAE